MWIEQWFWTQLHVLFIHLSRIFICNFIFIYIVSFTFTNECTDKHLWYIKTYFKGVIWCFFKDYYFVYLV